MSDLTPWERLRDAQLVEGDAPRDEQPHWSGRFLLGMVGWIAALFLLFFLFMAFEQLTRDPNNALTMGMVLMAAALGLNRMATRSDLWDQFVLALALAPPECRRTVPGPALPQGPSTPRVAAPRTERTNPSRRPAKHPGARQRLAPWPVVEPGTVRRRRESLAAAAQRQHPDHSSAARRQPEYPTGHSPPAAPGLTRISPIQGDAGQPGSAGIQPMQQRIATMSQEVQDRQHQQG